MPRCLECALGAMRSSSGQMSVEAALLLPVMLVLVALLCQPACILYTRSVMASAAGDAARAALTSRSPSEDLTAYVKRRLAAVPNVSIFHEGGTEAWEVEVAGPTDAGRVTVSIEGDVRPLPLLGSLVTAFGAASDGVVTLRVEVGEDLRSSWIGGSYEDWVGIWD